MNTVSSFVVRIACTQHVGVKLYYWCQNAVHKARISYQFFTEPVRPGCYNRAIILCESNNKWLILCCKQCVLHLIMYTVNNTKFFDYGVDAGDAQLDVRVGFRLFLLSMPIQFYETPQRELFVSHLCTLSPTCRGMGCYIYHNVYLLWSDDHCGARLSEQHAAVWLSWYTNRA